MLSPEMNATLTRVGPGTPCGELLRRYWQPVGPASLLTADRPTRRVRLLGEDLVVFRDGRGRVGCLAERCTHRGCSLAYGFVEGDGLRCAYHGWKYDAQGRCLEQPFEPQGSAYADHVRQAAYPAEELAGMLFVYMGPAPAPLVPHWDVCVRRDGRRTLLDRGLLDCNWLQCQENTADTTHTYFLHGHMLHQKGLPGGDYYYRPIERYDWSYCEWGIEKRCTYGGDRPEEEVRPPLIFPNILRIPEGANENLHWRVPVDDTHTRIWAVSFRPSEDGGDVVEDGPPPIVVLPPARDEQGDYILTSFNNQDRMAWETQGPVFDRSQEHLGATDRGIVMFRRLLHDQIEVVRRGGEPMCVLRDPEKNRIIEFRSHSYNRLS